MASIKAARALSKAPTLYAPLFLTGTGASVARCQLNRAAQPLDLLHYAVPLPAVYFALLRQSTDEAWTTQVAVTGPNVDDILQPWDRARGNINVQVATAYRAVVKQGAEWNLAEG